MRTFWIVFAALSALPAFAAGDARFNGRWDITGYSKPHPRAWWLEINGAETAVPGGKFVTAYAGDMNEIREISVEGSQLRFGFLRKERPKPGEEPKTSHVIFKARLVSDKLEGTYEIEGQTEPPMRWVGVRAPEIPDRDDGTWREGKPVKLFDGKDLKGWKAVGSGPPVGWSVKEGSLTSTGKATNLISDRKFWNFKLHIEYRMAPHSNSGIGLRARYEVQVADDYGQPPNSHGNGSIYSRVAPSENATRPAGEWQTYDIRLVGRQATVMLNGKTIIDKAEIEGLTAIAVDPHEAEPGPIYLQGDHGPVEYRNIVVTPLVR